MGTSDVVPVVDEQMRCLWWKSGDKRERRRRGVVAGAMRRRCNASYDMVARWIRMRCTGEWMHLLGIGNSQPEPICVVLRLSPSCFSPPRSAAN